MFIELKEKLLKLYNNLENNITLSIAQNYFTERMFYQCFQNPYITKELPFQSKNK